MNVHLDLVRHREQAQADLRDHYESVTLETLRKLWRQRLWVIGWIIVALATAMTLLVLLPRSYTAEALIQFVFLGQDARTISPAIDAGVLLESNVRYLSSRPMARSVAKRLTATHPEVTKNLSANWPGYLGTLREMLLPTTVVSDPVEKVARRLQKKLQVTNFTRAYLIAVTYTARSAETAATVANAFAQEFFAEKRAQENMGREAAARWEVLKLSNVYGADHPSLLAAQEQLELIRKQLADEKDQSPLLSASTPTGMSFIAAQPVATPSSPNGMFYLAAALVLGTTLGAASALMSENRDAGFRNADEVQKWTGVPCVGVIPSAPQKQMAEAMRILCITTGIIKPDSVPTVVLISTPLDDSKTSPFLTHLAQTLAESGRRVIAIEQHFFEDLAQPDGAENQIEKAPADEAAFHALLSPCGPGNPTILAPQDRISMTSFCSIESFITTARKSYDVVLVQTRPALLSHDALRLAPAADIHLHLVHWRQTRRHPTLVAVQQFKRMGALLSGIVLIETNLGQYRKYGAADQFYYFGAGRERSHIPGKAREPAQ